MTAAQERSPEAIVMSSTLVPPAAGVDRPVAMRTSSRRALLSAGFGAMAAMVASALGRPLPVRAGSDGDVILGSGPQSETTTTYIFNGSNNNDVFWATGNGTGTSVYGRSNLGVGVWGESETGSYGVRAQSNSGTGLYAYGGVTGIRVDGGEGIYATSPSTGVRGQSSGTATAGVAGHSIANATGVIGFSAGIPSVVPDAKPKTGVYGEATQDAASRGVWGHSTTGTGVRGEATSGAAVVGTASSKAGYAFHGAGRFRLDKVSGVATIAANATSVKVTPGTDVTTGSFVLLTAQANIGTRSLYYMVDAAGDTITIHISSSRTSSTVVAWLLLN